MATHTDTALVDRNPADLRKALEKAEVSDYAVGQIVWLLDYARANSRSIKTLAIETGISSSGVISQMFNARYPGNYILRARKIEKFRLDQAKRSLFAGRDDFVETTLYKSLAGIFDKTRYARRIQVIQSPEQLGKSRSATEYARANNGGRTVMVTLKPGVTSNPVGVCLRDLAIAAGTKDIRHRQILDIRYDLREALSVCDLVIIDEFHQIEHWSDKAIRDMLDYIRTELHADGERGVALIATNSDVLSLLKAFQRRSRYNLGQLLGRMCNQVLDIYPEEIPPEDVAALTERYYKPGKRAMSKLYDLTTRKSLGHFGLLLDILNRAWTECKVANQPMTDSLVMDIARETMADIESKEKELQLRH